jgi:putative flippase GtrA
VKKRAAISWLNHWQIIRFAAVSGGGTVIDYAATLALRTWTPTPLLAAVVLGYTIGAVVNYLGHSYFTYRNTAELQRNIRHFLRYYSGTLLALGSRLGTVFLLSLCTNFAEWIIIALGIGVSFICNYVVATGIIFRPESK